ncbi:MAG: CoA transferase [Proteobacteria bacterium]|nr:CoA transferase [Pseudomonadota bacterium]
MNKSLNDCTIAGPFQHAAAPFAATVFSLFYQFSTLGLKIASSGDQAADEMFSFAFKTPHTAPVNCVVTGWGGCNHAGMATENMIQAACGLMSVHGRSSGKIQSLGLPYVSTVTAALALQGGIAAALGQLRGLALSHSHVSMSAAALLSAAQYIADATVVTPAENLPPAEARHSTAPPFVSADGVIFEFETLHADPWLRFWMQLGISAALAGKGWTAFLLRYAKAVAPIPGELISALAKLTYLQISELCADSGLSICRVRTIAERVDNEQFKSEWLKGPWTFDFAASCQDMPLKPASDSLPLSGLTVIESCRRIQGPLAGHLLALLGADVIRIEPPGGDPLRGMPPVSQGCSVRFDALNRFKAIREIDIKSSVGQEEITELARHADVFLHNWAPGKAAQLNLDYSDLIRVNPALVYAYAAGWATDGDAHVRSPAMPGTDFMVQAYSGVAQKISQACGTQGGTLFTILDVLGGVIAAQGITAALLNRQLSRAGARVTSSLLSAATVLCSGDFQNRHRFFDIAVPAKSLLNQVFGTKQGKIAIDCYDSDAVQRLIDALSLAMHPKQENFQQRLSEILQSKTAVEWVGILLQADVPAAIVVENLSNLHSDSRLQSNLELGSYTKVTSPWSFQ